MTAANSFSGTHPFRPACLIQAYADGTGVGDEGAEALTSWAVNAIMRGRCPRCLEPLPQPPISPAGSRVTRCRCIPVCEQCGAHESMTDYTVDDWPLDAEPIHRWHRELMPQATMGVLDPSGVLMTEDGVTTINLTPTTGGWAELGYDESGSP